MADAAEELAEEEDNGVETLGTPIVDQELNEEEDEDSYRLWGVSEEDGRGNDMEDEEQEVEEQQQSRTRK